MDNLGKWLGKILVLRLIKWRAVTFVAYKDFDKMAFTTEMYVFGQKVTDLSWSILETERAILEAIKKEKTKT